MSRESIHSASSNLTAAAGESESAQAAAMSVWELAIDDLAAWLPHTFSRISPTRAALLADQMEEISRSETAQRLVCVAAATGPPVLTQSVIAIAVLTSGSDTANILHVDWLQPGSTAARTGATVGRNSPVHAKSFPQAHAAAVWQKLATIFSSAGVRFAQWATDPGRPPLSRSSPAADLNVYRGAEVSASGRTPPTAAGWHEAMNFTRIGTLKYLYLDDGATCQYDATGKYDATGESSARVLPAEAALSADRTHRQVILRALDSRDAIQTLAFEHVTERTYVDSLDCPPLAQFRSPREIIDGYRAAASFAPDLWYTVDTLDDTDGEPITIGCIILARHRGPVAGNPDRIHPACVVELVYMGIVPEHRGRNYAESMLARIVGICQQLGAERLILAVDETNAPALAVYQRSGMLPLFRETVWGRSV